MLSHTLMTLFIDVSKRRLRRKQDLILIFLSIPSNLLYKNFCLFDNINSREAASINLLSVMDNREK